MGERARGLLLWLGDHVAGAIVSAIVVAALATFMTSMSDVMNMGAAYPVPFWKLTVAAVAIGAAAGYGSSVLLGIRDARARREESEHKERETARAESRRMATAIGELTPAEASLLLRIFNLENGGHGFPEWNDEPVIRMLDRLGAVESVALVEYRDMATSKYLYHLTKKWRGIVTTHGDEVFSVSKDSTGEYRAGLLRGCPILPGPPDGDQKEQR